MFLVLWKLDDVKWKIGDYNDCWENCNFKSGICSWCGPGGYCCSGIRGDCERKMLVPLIEYWKITGNGYHMCIIPTQKIGK